MNRRVSLESIADRLRSQLLPGDRYGIAKIASSLDHDFLSGVGESSNWPAVWVGAQRSTPIDEGNGYSGRIRQHVSVEIAIRVIVQRYIAGEGNEEDQLNRICDAVADALIGYTPDGATRPLVWVQSIDGPPEQSVMTADLLFRTEITYQS